MKISIGLRATPDRINYTILKEENEIIERLALDYLVSPKSLDLPDRLKFVRQSVLDLILEYKINSAGIRIAESNANQYQCPSIPRGQLETVATEALASSTVVSYFSYKSQKICRLLGINNFENYIKKNGSIPVGVKEDDWPKNENQRESFLTAMGALKK